MADLQHGIPYPGPAPLPEPDHARRIRRQKSREIAAVLVIVAACTALAAWQSPAVRRPPEAARAMREAAAALEALGAAAEGETPLAAGRTMRRFAYPVAGFAGRVDLVGRGPEAPVETAIVALCFDAAQPPDAAALQAAVDRAGAAAQALVPRIGETIARAAATSEWLADAPRPHDKGVAGSDDGWKTTWAAYRSFEPGGGPQPMLYCVVQRLEAGGDPALTEFNRALYDAVHRGIDTRTALTPAAP